MCHFPALPIQVPRQSTTLATSWASTTTSAVGGTGLFMRMQLLPHSISLVPKRQTRQILTTKARLWEVTRIVAESFMAFCVKVAHSAVSMCRFPELRRLRLAASMIEERSLGGIWTVILLVMDSWQSKCEARHQRRLSNRHCPVYSKLYDADGRNQFSIWRRI